MSMLFFWGCGAVNDAENEDEDPNAIPAKGNLPFMCPGHDLHVVQGWNEDWKVDHVTRKFYADLPTVDAATPIAVVFSFHGIFDTVDNWRTFFAPPPNGYPDFPFAHISFEDTNLAPYGTPQGLFWDMFVSHTEDDNREALLFEAVLACLSQTQFIDETRIYSVGFSGGAIITNMLHARYPEYLGAIVAESGAWFNDPDERETGVVPPGITLEWNDLDDRQATVLLTHGGAGDTFGPDPFGFIANFEEASMYAIPFLRAHGRTVLDCPHAEGHTKHPLISNDIVMRFLQAHHPNTDSPYLAEGLPAELQQAGCNLNPPE
jgi:predicted esterase